MYVNCHSYYSLRYGTLTPQELVEFAVNRKLKSIALADINSTAAAYPFWCACRDAGIRAVLGIEFRNGDDLCFIGLARNQEGWAELCQLLTDSSVSGRPLPGHAPAFKHCYALYPRLIKPIGEFQEHEFLAVQSKHLSALFRSPVIKRPDKLVAWSPVTIRREAGDHLTHRLLRAVDHNTVLSKLTYKQVADEDAYFFEPQELRDRFATHPYLLSNAERILDTCNLTFDEGDDLNRQFFTDSEEGDFALLEKLAHSGCRMRFGQNFAKAFQRLEKELRVIRQQGFCAYFLITWDIIRYAQAIGYHHVGRGSGANSIVAYALRISDVDPLELDLYFERFINPNRTSPPDFDIDFSWDVRDDVIDYVFKRYGAAYTALLATTVTFKYASIVRELGKVYGLPKAEIDVIVRNPEARDTHHELAETIRQQGRRLANFPNYLSIHAGGILIAHRPLNLHTALLQMPKGFPIVHFDMYTAERWGFHKFDVLSQRGLGHIKDCVDLVRHNHNQAIDIHDIPKLKADKKVRARLKSGHCLGCFYIESPAMRGLLAKLGCEDYVHLVAASSIIRPGVAKSGMMRTYIERYHDRANIRYLHPVFEEHLGETFGVMVYQEDVMKIAHHFSGLPLDDCDVLRRIMSGKKHRQETMDELRDRYFEGCRQRGHDRATSEEVWRQIASFAGYSFCKAHSASFAVESFQSLYLKVYYPLEFMVAVINNFGGFYRTEFYVHEARMEGGTIHPPCVNTSLYLTTLSGTDITLGFVHLRGMEQKLAQRIVRERAHGGTFRDLGDFVRRTDCSGPQLQLLIRIGALRFTGLSKSALLWERNAHLRSGHHHRGSRTCANLFEPAQTYELPELPDTTLGQSFDEIELLGFPLCSPFNLVESLPSHTINTTQFRKHIGKSVRVLGYFVARKDLRTQHGNPMAFGTWLDTDGHYFDSTHFPGRWKHGELHAGCCYLLHGVVQEDFEFLTVNVLELERLAFQFDERYVA